MHTCVMNCYKSTIGEKGGESMNNLYQSKLKQSDGNVSYAICPCKGSCFLSCAGDCTGNCVGSCAGTCSRVGGVTV